MPFTCLSRVGLRNRTLKRTIDLKDIAALTRSLISTQFIIHTFTDFLRFRTSKADELIELTKVAYVSQLHKNLSIYGADQKDLKGVTKIKNDFKLLSDQNLMKEESKTEVKEDVADEQDHAQDTASDDEGEEPTVVETNFDEEETD